MWSWYIKLLQAGSLPDQPYGFENRRILLLNKIALVACAITALIVSIHLFIGNTVQPMVVSLGFLVCIPTIKCQSIGRYKLARLWFLIGFYSLIAVIFFHSVVLNLDTSTEYVLIILIPLTIILLDRRISAFASLFIIVSGACFVAYRYNQSEVVRMKEFAGLEINWLTISFTVYFCMNFFKKSLLKANELIAQDKEELAVADRTKNFLFAVISHDIRSPLNTLKQYFLLDPEQRKDPDQFMIYQESLSKKVDDISQTLDDLLFWSKSQLQGITVNPSAFLPVEVIKKVTLIAQDLIHKKKVTLISDDHTNEQICCDRDHLTVVIRNLVQNAIKFTPPNGAVTISSIAEENNILICIEDTGKGMDEQTLRNLQAGTIVQSHLGTAGEIGTGLGLSLVKELIAKNQGSINIESQVGIGTKISLYLPKA